MPDIADEHANFRDAMRRAEEASGIVRDETGTELNGIEAYVRGETPVVLPELEGAEPVQASDQPLTPAEPAEVVVDTSQEQQAAEAEAATPTVEELIAEREKLLAQVEEQKLMIGRQSTEVGETREQMARIEAEIAAVKAAQSAPQPAPAIAITQELIDENPALAAQAAFDQKNQPALEAAWNAWDAEGDGAAKLWLAERRAEQREAALKAQIDATQKALEEVRVPLQQAAAVTTEAEQWKEAFDEVKATRPDFMANAERLLVEVAPEYPDIAHVLSTGDGKAKAQALAALYALDKMGNPEAVKQQLEEAAQEAAAEAAATRNAAGAVTSQHTVGQPTVEMTAEEQESDAYVQRQKGRVSLARGWTGRSA